MESQGKTIYLPPIYDSKKVREGIKEIINLLKMSEQMKYDKVVNQ